MEQNLEHSIALLSRLPAGLNALLRDLPEAWTFSNEGDTTWSAFDVIGHLLDLERRHWMPRVKLALRGSVSETFDPVDRWAQTRESKDRTLSQLLDEFIRLRSDNLADLRALELRPEDLMRQGHHPALGPVTLSEVLATWVVHDLTHLHQISRILAVQYQGAVGPWGKYLGVLSCEGHSA